MRTIASIAVACLVLGFAPVVAAASQCPSGTQLYCPNPAPNAKAPPPCRCVPVPPGSWSGGGKSDIKKKNVPQVQPNKRPKD